MLNGPRKRVCIFVTFMLVAYPFENTFANDSAASTAIGGIQLRREASISMEKERLTISESKITVEYEFLNETDRDITTEVAFPIPIYDYGFTDPAGSRGFDDFRLWVEGRELKYNIDSRAKLNGKDYTDMLKKYGLDIGSFGHYDTDNVGDKEIAKGDIPKLSVRSRQELSRIGLIADDEDSFPDGPLWSVVKTYHWTQTFPAHKILHVRHEYTPVLGFTPIETSDLAPQAPHQGDTGRIDDLYKVIKNSCVDPGLRKQLTSEAERGTSAAKKPPSQAWIEMSWVDYILTTANSWKTPIKDFTLVVERPSSRPGTTTQHVSLCWPGPIKSSDANHFMAHETNFVPQSELHVAFFYAWSGS